MAWNTFTFIIGSMDDFESTDELIDHFEGSNYPSSICNCSSYEFDAPSGLHEDVVTMIGRGMAFSDGWSMDGSVSFVVKGVV
tara:strand:+ start:774 stop:1019 length:246 start_codon:yes stop_codon:yes gene_type:complete